MKIYHNRLRDAWHVPGLMRLLSRQSISLCVTLLFLTCVYYAGFWLGETSSSYKDNDWKASMVTNEGFLEVSKILADPKTTNDPMVGWIVNKQQPENNNNNNENDIINNNNNNNNNVISAVRILPSVGAVLRQMSSSSSPASASASSLPTTTSQIRQTKDLFVDAWIRSAASACHGKKSPVVLLTVVSAPENGRQREAIRDSWGRLAAKHEQTAIIYLVGTPPEEEGLNSLLLESDLHGDLAISQNIDTYQNLTLKTLSAFRWLQTFCPAADFILKIDDDMFIQTQRLRQLVKGLRLNPKGTPIIVGNVATNWEPVRNKESKYYISESQYSESTYPPFVTGPSYLVSRSAVDLILPEALEHPFIHLEDVFITGIVAERTDVPRRLATEFRNNAVPIPARFLGCTLLRTISIHKVPPEEQSQLTKMAKNPVCGTAKV